MPLGTFDCHYCHTHEDHGEVTRDQYLALAKTFLTTHWPHRQPGGVVKLTGDGKTVFEHKVAAVPDTDS